MSFAGLRGSFWKKKGGGNLDPDYQAVIDYAVLQGYTLPDSATQTRDSNRVANLKTEGVWSELDVLYIFEQSSGCSDFARINFKDPSSHYLTAAPTYSIPTFEAGNGFKGGTSLGFNSNWNANVDAVNFVNNDACFIFKGYDYLGSNNLCIAYARTGNNTSQISIVELATSQVLHRIATTAGAMSGLTTGYDSNCLFNRNGSNRAIYIDGVLHGSSTGINGPGAFSNLDLYLMCANENGSTTSNNVSGLKYIGWGSDQSSKASEISDIFNDIY